MGVGDRGDHQHDYVGPANGFGDIGRQEVDPDKSLVNAACLDTTLRPQGGEALGTAGVQTHRVTAFAKVSSGGATTMPSPKNRNRVHSHLAFRVRYVMEQGSWAAWLACQSKLRVLRQSG
jgi:hypothetical protein